MRIMLIAVGVAGLVLGLVNRSNAQQTDRVYPIVELTDEDVALIAIKDGYIDDWEEVVGEPTVTALEFRPNPRFTPYDPVSLDFRIWLGWHDATNRVYVAMQRSDDVYINEYPKGPFGINVYDSAIDFGVDGDRSGGQFVNFLGLDEDEYRLRTCRDAQPYDAIAEVFDNAPQVVITPLLQSWVGGEDWFYRPPYAEGGGGVAGENPTISVTEFYVTPFDRLVWNSEEESVVSELYRGKIIGFSIMIIDMDVRNGVWKSIHYLRAGENLSGSEGDNLAVLTADEFVAGLLVGPGGEIPDESAVESITWGRIKARFVR